MFDRFSGAHPFLGPSERLTLTIPSRATFQHPVSTGTRKNENLNRPYQDNEPATPQPAATGRTNDDTPVGAVRGAMNVAPPGMEGTVKALKKEPGIDNPFALAWWMKDQGYKSHK